MKKIIYLVLISVFAFSCETEKKVKSEIDFLKQERTELQNDVTDLSRTIKLKTNEVDKLNEDLKIGKIYKSGKTPRFILKLRLKQSHVSLSISKHIKDEMNTIEFEIPVDEEFYKSVKVGTNIIDEFRSGSFIMDGSFGNWKMKVVDKKIK